MGEARKRGQHALRGFHSNESHSVLWLPVIALSDQELSRAIFA